MSKSARTTCLTVRSFSNGGVNDFFTKRRARRHWALPPSVGVRRGSRSTDPHGRVGSHPQAGSIIVKTGAEPTPRHGERVLVENGRGSSRGLRRRQVRTSCLSTTLNLLN